MTFRGSQCSNPGSEHDLKLARATQNKQVFRAVRSATLTAAPQATLPHKVPARSKTSQPGTTLLTISVSITFLLEHFFVRKTGVTPHAWLAEMRHFRGLSLRIAGMSIKQPAYELGYRDRSHFSQAFQSFFGLPPSKTAEVVRRMSLAKSGPLLGMTGSPQLMQAEAGTARLR